MEMVEAFRVISKMVRSDKDYREGWVANIAMSFKDAWHWELRRKWWGRVILAFFPYSVVHRVANRAAEHFVDDQLGRE